MKAKELTEDITVKGDFSNLSVFDFEGVYIICDLTDTVVYVGSAYGRPIMKRLKQYLSETDTGNSLGQSIAKELSGSSSFDENAKEKMKEAIEIIKEFKIFAIKHDDPEYQFIKKAKPIYNTRGNSEE